MVRVQDSLRHFSLCETPVHVAVERTKGYEYHFIEYEYEYEYEYEFGADVAEVV